MQQQKIKILIADVQTLLCDSLKRLINNESDMQVVCTVADAGLAVEKCRAMACDVVLLDVLTRNNSSGIAAASRLRAELPDVKIIIMTSLPEITFVDAAMKAGAHSFVYKHIGFEYLLMVIRSTVQGHGVYPGPQDLPPFTDTFSRTEIGIIRMVYQGMGRSETASALGMSESVLKNHIRKILDKSGFESLTRFAVYVAANGYILPDPLPVQTGG